MCQYLSISYYKTLIVGRLCRCGNMGICACFTFPAQLLCEPKTTLRKEVYLKVGGGWYIWGFWNTYCLFHDNTELLLINLDFGILLWLLLKPNNNSLIEKYNISLAMSQIVKISEIFPFMSYLSEYNLLIDSESLLIYSQSILMHEHIRTSISICVNNTRVRWRLHPLFNKMEKKKKHC